MIIAAIIIGLYCVACAAALTFGKISGHMKVDTWVIVATALMPIVAAVGLVLGAIICILVMAAVGIFFCLVPVGIAFGGHLRSELA